MSRTTPSYSYNIQKINCVYDPTIWRDFLCEDPSHSILHKNRSEFGLSPLFLFETEKDFVATVFTSSDIANKIDAFCIDKESIAYADKKMNFLEFVETIVESSPRKRGSIWILSMDCLLSEDLKTDDEVNRAYNLLTTSPPHNPEKVLSAIEFAIQNRIHLLNLLEEFDSSVLTLVHKLKIISCFLHLAVINRHSLPISYVAELYDASGKGYARFSTARLAEVMLYRHSKIACYDHGKPTTSLRYRYHSRDVATYRSFIKKIDKTGPGAAINLQNLSNDSPEQKRVISSDPDGSIFEFDFATQEFTILKHLCGLEALYDHDIHQKAADLLVVDRAIAKKANYAVIYGAGDKTVRDLFVKHKVTQESKNAYYDYIYPAHKAITDYVEKTKKTGFNDAYTFNSYGRVIVLEKDEKSRANRNRIIQSISSEILVDTIIRNLECLKNKKSKILFHKWDSLFIDVYREEETEIILAIRDIMKNQANGMIFNIDIKRGSSLGCLKPYQI